MSSINKPRTTVSCPECERPMKLLTSNVFKYRNGQFRRYWRCSDKKCSGRHGAHPDGTPLGRPAKKEVRQARTYLHLLFDQIWDTTNKIEKRAMQLWLANNTSTGHVSDMDLDEIWATVKKLEMLEL